MEHFAIIFTIVKAELVALLQNNPPPAPQMSTWEPIDDRLRPDRPRQPPSSAERGASASTSGFTQREMDIFEQQEITNSRPQVKNKLNDWYDWLVNHVPSTIKDVASRAFKTFKDKIMGLYNRVTGSTANQTQLKGSGAQNPNHLIQ